MILTAKHIGKVVMRPAAGDWKAVIGTVLAIVGDCARIAEADNSERLYQCDPSAVGTGEWRLAGVSKKRGLSDLKLADMLERRLGKKTDSRFGKLGRKDGYRLFILLGKALGR